MHADARLRLREFQPGDASDVLALHADPRVRALLPDEQPLHEPRWAANFLACLRDFYRRHEGLGIWRCAVPLTGGGEQFTGWFSLMPMQPATDAAALGVGPGDVELGSRLLPAHWGSGLSLLGGEVLLRHAFTRQQVRAVWGVCHPDNRAARACLDALGFAPRGRARYEGQLSDHHVLEAADWPAIQPLSHRERLRRHRQAAAPSSPVPA
ncbi:MAG: N-acetyltransferase [Burkholderiales bacterium]|nr:MAG: N-acetyltransferase [Burkholderiales bacterium]